MSTLLYLNARLATDQLQAAMEAGASEEKVNTLLAEALSAWEAADAAVDGTRTLASALEQAEDNPSYKGVQEQANASEAATKAQRALFPWVGVAYADMEDKMKRFVQDVEEEYASAKPGHRLEAIAERYHTDIKQAHAMLRQVQAFRNGAEYKMESEEYGNSIALCKTYKASSEVVLLATGAVVCPPTTGLAYVTTGVSAVAVSLDAAEASIAMELGDDHPLTRSDQEKVQSVQDDIAPIVAITGLVSLNNLTPEKLMQAKGGREKALTIIDGLWNGINLTNDAVQEGKILGMTVNFGGGPNGETTIMGTELDMAMKGTSQQKVLEELAKKAGLRLDLSADPNDPATQPHEMTSAEVDKYREEVKTDATADQVKETVAKMEEDMPKAISNDTDGIISTEEAIAILDKLAAELEAQRQAEIKAENEEIQKMLDEVAAEWEKEQAQNAAKEDQGGYQFSNIPIDMSDLKTSEISGTYHVTGTFKSPVFGEIPVDDTIIIAEQGGQAVEIKGTGHGGVNETGTMSAENLTGSWSYECYGYWGYINTKLGKVDIMRQGTDTEKDTIVFTATLADPEAQTTYELKGAKA